MEPKAQQLNFSKDLPLTVQTHGRHLPVTPSVFFVGQDFAFISSYLLVTALEVSLL